MQWVRLTREWSNFGFASRGVFHMAVSQCRRQQNWHSKSIVELLSSMSKTKILHTEFMLDLQNTKWGQRAIDQLNTLELQTVLHCYGRLVVNAPDLMGHILDKILHAVRARRIRRSQAVVAAWSLAVHGIFEQELAIAALSVQRPGKRQSGFTLCCASGNVLCVYFLLCVG